MAQPKQEPCERASLDPTLLAEARADIVRGLRLRLAPEDAEYAAQEALLKAMLGGGGGGGLLRQGTYGFYKTALNYAIRTLHAFTDSVTDPTTRCAMRSDVLRGYIEDASVPIITNPGVLVDEWFDDLGCDEHVEADFEISGSGRVAVRYDYGEDTKFRDAWAYFGEVRLCERNRTRAALADYYFWWATRLLHYSVYRGGGFVAAKVAVACARAGLAEIMSLAGLLLHEYGHISGSAYHCADVFGRYSCCQYLIQYLWIQQVTARFGLPRSQLDDPMITDYVYVWDSGNDRFDPSPLADGTRPWTFRLTVPSTIRCGEDTADPTYVEGNHCDLLDLEHRVDITWGVRADCANASSSGSFSRFTSYAHCGGGGTGTSSRRKKGDTPSVERPERDRLYE